MEDPSDGLKEWCDNAALTATRWIYERKEIHGTPTGCSSESLKAWRAFYCSIAVRRTSCFNLPCNPIAHLRLRTQYLIITYIAFSATS
eukprot:g5409.t1